jgi:hypothetical protein
VFGGNFETAVKYFARNLTAPIHPPLVAVLGVLQNEVFGLAKDLSDETNPTPQLDFL